MLNAVYTLFYLPAGSPAFNKALLLTLRPDNDHAAADSFCH